MIGDQIFKTSTIPELNSKTNFQSSESFNNQNVYKNKQIPQNKISLYQLNRKSRSTRILLDSQANEDKYQAFYKHFPRKKIEIEIYGRKYENGIKGYVKHKLCPLNLPKPGILDTGKQNDPLNKKIFYIMIPKCPPRKSPKRPRDDYKMLKIMKDYNKMVNTSKTNSSKIIELEKKSSLKVIDKNTKGHLSGFLFDFDKPSRSTINYVFSNTTNSTNLIPDRITFSDLLDNIESEPHFKSSQSCLFYTRPNTPITKLNDVENVLEIFNSVKKKN